MMHFTTDQQTLNDLTIFGKPGAESIYSLFNRTQTQGGARWMEEMFRYPMADPEAIQSRVELIQYVGQTFESFPFNREGFDMLEVYLADTDERSRLPVRETSITDRLKGMVAVDAQLKQITAGIRATADILHRWPTFIQSWNGSFIHPFMEDLRLLDKQIKDAGLNELGKAPLKKNLAYEDVRAHDNLLRFKERDLVSRILHAIYRLDAYLAVAQVARERNFCYPQALASDHQEIQIEGVYHPYVQGAIANSLHIHPDGNIVFLTGANMAGKSTLMKSLGIALYLAHMGFPVAAERMAFSPREGVYTSINLPDNLSRGISHFYAEVLRVKKVARELGAGKKLFIMMDELFRGTNVKDAYEATVALTQAFADKSNCMFVVSTHIMEAGETLRDTVDTIQFVYLPTEMDGNRPVYTYRLKEGITADRHGMIIVQNEGILDILDKNKAFNAP